MVLDGLRWFWEGGEGCGGVRKAGRSQWIGLCDPTTPQFASNEAQCVIESNIDCRASDLGLTQQQKIA